MSPGQRVSGITVVPPVALTDCAYVVSDDDGSNFWKSIWVAGHDFAPTELINTRLNMFSLFKEFSDPMLSPDRTKVVYGTVPQDGTINTVDVIDVDDTNHAQIATYGNASGGGVNAGMQPFWHPDGDRVLYAETVASGDTSQDIRRVNTDGTGDTAIYSHNRSADGYVMFPSYNFDGSRIAFYADKGTGNPDQLWTLLADGSSPSNFASRSRFVSRPGPIAWANTQDKMAWGDAVTGAVKIANGDGTGITTIWTDPNPLYPLTRFAWLPDDSGLAVERRIPTDPDPQMVLTVVDAAGGGITDISPERRAVGVGPLQDMPHVFQDRIWWAAYDDDWFGTPTNDTQIVSVLPDGSGYTIEDTIEDVTGNQFFAGFEGREF